MPESKKDIIARLQKDILQWQGFTPPATGRDKGIGLGPLEMAFPNDIFPIGNIHEMMCPTPEQAAATGGMLAGLMAILMKYGGACIWISTSRKLFPASLKSFNVEPEKIVFIDVAREKDALWVMEEALKCEGLAAVVAEIREISFPQSRRLQLAVESSKVTGFILRNHLCKPGTNTCVARWQISPLPSTVEDELPGIGFPCWQVELLRVRNGNPGSWKLAWIDSCFVPNENNETTHHLQERKAG
jgi:protein ImuA